MFKKSLLVFCFSLLVSASVACVPTQQSRALAKSLQPSVKAAAQTVPDQAFYLPPEYQPIQALIVSENILNDENGFLLLDQVLSAGVQVWLLSASQSNFDWTREHLHGVYHYSDLQLQKLLYFPVKTESTWARDWAPLMTLPEARYRGPAVDVRMLKMRYLKERPVDDQVPQELAKTLLQRVQELPGLNFYKLDLPFYGEGGNIMCSRRNCFVTEELLRMNSEEYLGVGQAIEPKQIRAALEAHLDQKVWSVHRLPYESTGHIDMWAKFLNPQTVIVAELSDETLKYVPPPLREHYREVQEYLNIEATGQTSEGKLVPDALATLLHHFEPQVKIVRIPMPAPGIYARDLEVFRSYTNSLLLNGKAIVPKYRRFAGYARTYDDQALTSEYERQVQRVYEQAGYQVIWLDADYLIQDGGAWHCAAMQVPQP